MFDGCHCRTNDLYDIDFTGIIFSYTLFNTICEEAATKTKKKEDTVECGRMKMMTLEGGETCQKREAAVM